MIERRAWVDRIVALECEKTEEQRGVERSLQVRQTLPGSLYCQRRVEFLKPGNPVAADRTSFDAMRIAPDASRMEFARRIALPRVGAERGDGRRRQEIRLHRESLLRDARAYPVDRECLGERSTCMVSPVRRCAPLPPKGASALGRPCSAHLAAASICIMPKTL